ncbi:ABC transporter ATP-binding protein [Plantactinospora sp. GCM10030261]|uniref:ABC transporter ATP-binding protein n=1 Tax=Plantactinospora sp. GCM10030261 TaxID=3273420 RepID=UPI003621FE3B
MARLSLRRSGRGGDGNGDRAGALWRAGTAAAALAARSSPPVLVIVLVLTLFSGGLPIAIAWLTKLILDRIVDNRATGDLVAFALALAATSLVAGVIPHLLRYLHAELGRRIARSAQDRLYRAVNGFAGLARFEDPRFLDRLQLAQQAGAGTPEQLVAGGANLLRGLVLVSGFLGSVVTISPTMAVAVSLGAVPVLLAELWLSRRRADTELRVSPYDRREFFYRTLLSSLQAAKEIRIFGIGDFLRERMLAERIRSDRARRQMDRREALVQSSLGLLAAGIAGAGLVWVVQAAAAGRLTIGDVPMFVAALAAVQGGLAGLVADVTTTHHNLLMFTHYQAVVRAAPDLPVPKRVATLPSLRTGIEFHDVWFRYGDDHPWVLRGVSLRITYGETLALVGANGAGKSTMVKLLCRFYDPTRGTIRWDGVDLRDVPVADLRRRIGVTFQDYMHYDLTGAENIGLGDLDGLHDRPRIESAARMAGVHGALRALPYGYDTLLSRTFMSGAENNTATVGVTLSGGQWQRLALARAFLRDRSDLLILDEPSAGLDPDAEAEIHQAMRAHRTGRTTLLITHRLGTVREADLIVVLRDGRVAEAGRHQDLLAADTEYARMFGRQASGYREPEPAHHPGTE